MARRAGVWVCWLGGALLRCGSEESALARERVCLLPPLTRLPRPAHPLTPPRSPRPAHPLFPPCSPRPCSPRPARRLCFPRPAHRAGLPTPLATIDDPSALLRRGVARTRSARGKESDGGAMMVRLVFARYARDLGWRSDGAVVAPDLAMRQGRAGSRAGSRAGRGG